MPTFCRHNRFEANCPICSKPTAPTTGSRSSSASRPRSAGASRSTPRAGGLRVRRIERAADDGYESSLVPGLRARADAARLAEEIAFACGRLAVLATDPPEPYASAASEPDRATALRAVARIAFTSPRTGLDEAGVERALSAYDAWAQRAGSPQAAFEGDAAWTPERRFERVFERLGTLPGVGRAARYDLLVTLGHLGLVDVRPTSLHTGDRDDTTLAAKRVFGIGDRLLLDRRAAELAAACEVPIESLDLALAKLDRAASDAPRRLGVDGDAADPAARERVSEALGVAGDEPFPASSELFEPPEGAT